MYLARKDRFSSLIYTLLYAVHRNVTSTGPAIFMRQDITTSNVLQVDLRQVVSAPAAPVDVNRICAGKV